MRNLSTINKGEDILTVEALTLSSNTTNAVLLTIGNTTQSISQTTLRKSLGLGDWAYRSSPLAENDIPSLSISKITNLQTTLDAKALKTRNIIAGTGLTGGGTLEADRTLSLDTSGVTAGTYKSVTVDTYGRVTAGTNPTTLSGYGITDAATKTELAATDTELGVTNNAVAAIDQRVSDIEQWAVNPTFNAAYIKDCAVDAINLGGVDVWNEGEIVKIGGGLNIATLLKVGTYLGINVDPSTSYRLYVNGDSRLEGKTYIGGTTYYLNGTSGWSYLPVLNLGGVMGSSQTHKLYVSGTSYFAGAITTGSNMAATFQGTTSVTKDTGLSVGDNFAGTTAALKVTGGLAIGNNLAVMGKKIYFDNSHYIELDGNGYLHTNVGFYSDSFVASGGIGNAGGGGGTSYNIVTWSGIQAGTGTGVASENTSYLPTAYALREMYEQGAAMSQSISTLSTRINQILNGTTAFSALYVNGSATIEGGISQRGGAIEFEDGHLYLSGANASSSTANTTQIVFGTSSNNHVAISSNTDAVIVNPSTSSTTGQIVLKVGSSPYISLGGTTAVANSSGTIELGYYLGTTNIKGSTVQINGNAVGNSAYKTVATTFGENANLPTCNAVNSYLNDQMRATNNAVAAVKRSLDDVLAWKVKPTAREMTVGTLGITDGINLGGVDVWNVGSAIHVGGNIYLAGSNGALYGTYNSTTYKKLISTNNYGYAIVGGESQVQVGSTSYATTISGSSISVNGATSISGTLSVGNYPVLGKKTYDLTSFFALAQGATFTTIDSTPVGTFISDIQNGHTELCVKGSVTLNGVAYTPRYNVQVGATTGQDISLYYVKLGSTPPLTFELLQFSYSGGAWKITNRISKSIS